MGATGAPACHAAQRGAEDPYATQYFKDTICQERTLLGACKRAESAASAVAAAPTGATRTAAPTVLKAPEEEQSELVKRLLAKTAANEEANAQLVKEKTVANGLSGVYGPFAKSVPIMRADGTFMDISFPRYDKLKDKGKIVRTATGLDAFAAGFDPDAPEPQREKLFGLF